MGTGESYGRRESGTGGWRKPGKRGRRELGFREGGSWEREPKKNGKRETGKRGRREPEAGMGRRGRRTGGGGVVGMVEKSGMVVSLGLGKVYDLFTK